MKYTLVNRIFNVLTLTARKLFVTDVTYVAEEECTRPCENEGWCEFEWRSSAQNIDAFDRVMHCHCPPGFSGSYCELSTAEDCSNLGCENNGQCIYEWKVDPQRTDAFVRVAACHCAYGFAGTHCEEDVSGSEKDCTLECLNGSTCKFERMVAPPSSGSMTYKDSLMICDCPAGFTGLHCEHEYQTCPDGTVCLNGTECVEDKREHENFSAYKCDCSAMPNGSTSCTFHTVSEFCDDGLTSSPNNFFCSNGGKCSRATIQNTKTQHHGCECRKGFEGRYCEHAINSVFVKDNVSSIDSISFTKEASLSKKATFFGSNDATQSKDVILLIIAGVVCVFVLTSYLIIRRQNRTELDRSEHESGSCDDTDDFEVHA